MRGVPGLPGGAGLRHIPSFRAAKRIVAASGPGCRALPGNSSRPRARETGRPPDGAGSKPEQLTRPLID